MESAEQGAMMLQRGELWDKLADDRIAPIEKHSALATRRARRARRGPNWSAPADTSLRPAEERWPLEPGGDMNYLDD
jgi:hypothetical protein